MLNHHCHPSTTVLGDIVFTISGRFCQADPFQNFQIYNDAYLRYVYGFRHCLGNTYVAVTCCQSKAHICRRIIGTCTQYCIHTYSVHVCRLLSSHFPHDYFSSNIHVHQWHTYTVLQTFVGVVSDVLTISNGQSSDQTERKRRESDDPGTSLLITLDKFALRSFDSSLGVFEDDNLSKLTSIFILLYLLSNVQSKILIVEHCTTCSSASLHL